MPPDHDELTMTKTAPKRRDHDVNFMIAAVGGAAKGSAAGEGGVDDRRLFRLVGTGGADGRRRGGGARDAPQPYAVEVLQQVERDERPRALVGRLLLDPDVVLGAG